MIDRENVIRELKAARLFFEMGSNRADGVVGNLGCKSGMKYIDDALKLLKEQNDCENCAIAIEDRQPVVQCKDCKYGDSVKNAKGEPMINCVLSFEEWLKEPNWFCADGKRA